MTPFRNILRLFAGDFVAKGIQFATLVYLARVLGAESFGVLALALAVTAYLLLLSDFGLEYWAIRQVAGEQGIRELAGRVVTIRLLIGAVAYAGFLCLLPLFPDYPSLRVLLGFAGLSIFTQALGLRWALLGRERLGAAAVASVAGQIVATTATIALVHGADDVVWVAIGRLAGEVVTAAVYLRNFVSGEGGPPVGFTLVGWLDLLRPASVLGAILVLGALSYNFDSLAVGLILGPEALGHYDAAYKLVTIAIAASLTYYMGLFPALARTWHEGRAVFRAVAQRSVRLAALSSVPVAVGGTMLADHAVRLVFGSEYEASGPVLRILCWSALLVTLRGTYRNGLTAIGSQGIDLRTSALATAVNITLTLLLIPRFGLLGAASATVAADAVWLLLAKHYLDRLAGGLRLLEVLWRPLVAAVLMAGAMALCLRDTADTSLVLAVALAAGGPVYVATLAALREPEVLALLARTRLRVRR